MRSTLGGRLTALWVLTIGGSLTLLALCVAGVVFFSYVQNLNARISATRQGAPETLTSYHVPPGDPDAAARAIANHMYSSAGLRVVAFNSRVHVIAIAANPGSDRSDMSFESLPNDRVGPVARNSRERLALGLATAFGLESVTFSIGSINFDLDADPAVLTVVMQRFGVALLSLLVIIAIASYVIAQRLRREALRPIEEVITALEAFGLGDLSLRPVDAAAHDEFGRIAAAYNRAVERVTNAFGERDRAETEIRRFIADAAHQLRTPLTVIQGFIGILLKNQANVQVDRERILFAMDKQSRSMVSLIGKLTLLDHWREARANPQLTDIGDCVAGVILPLAAAFSDREVSLWQEPACYALVDTAEIREAFGNVLDNALKYGAQAPVTVTVRKDGGDVRVIVTDGGPGLTDDEKHHAFERFYRGEQRDVAGSGLGLAIAKRAVERAGGSISLESVRGLGTRVTITLPGYRLSAAVNDDASTHPFADEDGIADDTDPSATPRNQGLSRDSTSVGAAAVVPMIC